MSFRKDRIPPAASFYLLEFGRIGKPNSKGWASASCPFHASKSGRSFSVNIRSGAFHCWGCDAKGGDVIAFVRKKEGYSFRKACEVLGCWDDNGKPVKRRRHTEPRRYLVLDYQIDGVNFKAEIPDEPKNYLDALRMIHAGAADRLLELQRGEPEQSEGETETQWSILADSWQLIEWEKEAEDGR